MVSQKNKYNELCNRLKSETLINTVDVYRFKIELYKTKYANSTEVKKTLNTQKDF